MVTYHNVTVPKTIAKDAQEKAETALGSLGIGSPLNAFKTITVAGQPDVVADDIGDTLHFVAGTNITITTNAGTDTITFNAPSSAGTNSFGTISVSGQSDVVADAAPDVLTLVGTGIAITTNASTDTITYTPTYGSASGTVCQGDDSRLSDSRVPTAHAASHISTGGDAIRLDALAAPTDITSLNSSTTAHGLLPKLSNNAGQFLNGVGSWSSPSGLQSFGTIAVVGQTSIVASASPDTITLAGSTGLIINTNVALKTVNYSINFGSASGTVCQGNDARLSNARTPTLHAISHTATGADGIRVDAFLDPIDITSLNATTGHHGFLPKLSGNASHYFDGTGNWHNTPGAFFVSVKDFGAVGNGATNDAAAINAAIASLPVGGGRVYFPAGAYLFNSTLTFDKPGVYFGDGVSTTLICNFTSGVGIDISAQFVEFSHFRMTHNVVRADNQASIRCHAPNTLVHSFLMQSFSLGLTVEGTSSTIEHGTMLEGKASTGIGIWVSASPFDISIWDILINSSSNIAVGIRISSAGDVEMGRLSIIHCQYGLDVIALAGDSVASVWAMDSFFDNCGTNAIRMYASGSVSNIVRTMFTHIWASSAGSTGLMITSDTGGTITGVQINGGHFFLNTAGGVYVAGTNTIGIRFANSVFAQNGSSFAGIWIENGVNQFMISSCRLGSSDGLIGNGYGAVVAGPSNSNYVINGNDFTQNSIATFVDGGVGLKSVVGNLA